MKMNLAFSLSPLLILMPATSQGAVVFQEGFEYGQNACGSSLFTLPEFSSIWNGDRGNMPHRNATACVTTDQSRSGERSIPWEFPLDEGANCFLEANHPYGNDVWIEFWMYPSREGAYRSSTDDVVAGKLIYAYTSATPSNFTGPRDVRRGSSRG